MSLRRWTSALAMLPLVVGCSRKPAPAAAASPASGPISASSAPGVPGAPVPLQPRVALPTPPPDPSGGVSDVQVVANLSPAQVMTTLAGRQGAASGDSCGSAGSPVQCVDLVVARIPRTAKVPTAQLYVKKPAGDQFVGPCVEAFDGVDCASAVNDGPGAGVRSVGRRPKLEVTASGFQLRWRVLNLSSEPRDVKLVVYY